MLSAGAGLSIDTAGTEKVPSAGFEFSPKLEKSVEFDNKKKYAYMIERPFSAPSSPFEGPKGGSSWRLLGGRIEPPIDAAGMLAGTRYHGRATPLKGKGLPPPDDKEAHYSPTLKRWSPERSHLLQTRDLLGQKGYVGIPANSQRFTRQMTPDTNAVKGSKLRGTGGIVQQEPPAYRKQRGHGSPSEANLVQSGRRVLCAGDFRPEEIDPYLRGKRTFGRRVGMIPPSSTELMKAHYAMHNTEYRLDGGRMPSPQSNVKTSPELRNAFDTSVDSFIRNKVAGYCGSFVIG